MTRPPHRRPRGNWARPLRRRFHQHRQDRKTMFQSGNPHRLYLDTDRGWFLGVCAGIAAYLGTAPGLIRLIFIVMLMMFFPFAVLGYLILGLIVLQEAPVAQYRSETEEEFWRSVTLKPNETFQALRHKFRQLDQRLARMERHVTAEEFDLRRQFRDLEAGKDPQRN